MRCSTTLPGGTNAQLHPVLILIIYVIQLHSLNPIIQHDIYIDGELSR